jgi:hypothetical protein
MNQKPSTVFSPDCSENPFLKKSYFFLVFLNDYACLPTGREVPKKTVKKSFC